MDPASDGGPLDPLRGGDLLIGQALDVTEDDRGPVLGRERLERGLDVAVQVPIVKGVRWRPRAVTKTRRSIVAKALEPDSLLAAGHVKEQGGGNAVQPGLEGPPRGA